MINSICIVRLSALGDVLMLVPLVRTLQTYLPHVSITWVISRPAFDLVEGLEGVEFIELKKPEGIADYYQFAKKFRKRKFDVLLATQASFRANLLYPFIRAKRKIGYDSLRAKDGHRWFVSETITPGNDHTLEGFLKFAELLSIPEKKITWDIPIPAADLEWAKHHLPNNHQPVVILNPAASKPERSWSVDRYRALVSYLQKQWNANIILTGGPGEYDRLLADQIKAGIPLIDLVGKTKPKQLLGLIKQAELLICPDTGPSHMAAAVNTPVIALHAVTSAQVSGSYPFRHLAVDFYPEAVKTILQKTPNENVWGTHAHGSDTMQLVTLEAVIEKVNDFFLTFVHKREQ